LTPSNATQHNAFQEFQSFDEERTQFFRQVLEQYMTMLSALPPSLSTSCDVPSLHPHFFFAFPFLHFFCSRFANGATQALNKVVSEIDAASDVATFITNNR
jgi:hypothetical protein